MQIKKVTLQTCKLIEMKSFYVDTLGMPLIYENEEVFRVATGSSELEFTDNGVKGEPYYHFAFNIPANKFDEAKTWIKKRVPLNEEDGEDEAEFSSLHARSLYFTDPGGNVVEFISRQTIAEVSNAPFTAESIRSIGEISLTVDDAIKAGQQLMKLGIKERENLPLSNTTLNFMGERSNGSFILLVQPGRRWIFSDKISAIFPLTITLDNHDQITINNQNELIINTVE